MIPLTVLDSILWSGFKDLFIARDRGGEPRDPAEVVEVAQQTQLLDIVASNLNNNFEHEGFDITIKRLGASQLLAKAGDIGPHVFGVTGVPKGQFLPHQVWGVWFLVQRVAGNSPPVALLADDMGLGKTFTALGAHLHLKWISSQAKLGRRLAYLEGRTVEDLGDSVPPFFGSAKEVFQRPSLVLVPASLVRRWQIAIKDLSEGTGAMITNLNLGPNRSLTSESLNFKPEFPERGQVIHLISYETFRTRSRAGRNLASCVWGLRIFDESHNVRSKRTLTFDALFRAEVAGKFQLTGTPMYLNVHSWVTQTDWLFSKIDKEARGQH